LLVAVGLALGLAGCVFLPRTTQVFDADCRILSRQMVLEPVQLGAFHACANEGCQVLVVGAAITAAASLAISGTIVVAGNIAYWLERQAQCQPIPVNGVSPVLPAASGIATH